MNSIESVKNVTMPCEVLTRRTTFAKNGKLYIGFMASFGFPVMTSGPPVNRTDWPSAPQIRWKLYTIGKNAAGGGSFESAIGAGISSFKPGYKFVGRSG